MKHSNMTKQSSHTRCVAALIGSSKFFWGILALLALQAAWIACSGRYPMAFDEDFHLGIIRLYAHHLSPFWSGQPAGADMFGAVFRDPSYLYQYLMSFPYRLISVFTSDQTIQVLWLRAINIGLFAGGLAVYRRLLLKTGASRAIVHGCLLVFVLIPVVPLLAAQINYDNLFIPLVGLALLMTVNFNEELTRNKRINPATLLQVLILCLLASLVKYAFLPVFIAVVAYLVVRLWQVLKTPRQIWLAKVAAMKRLGTLSGLLLVMGMVISGGLFIERYGINLVRYHTPVPDCSKVLSVRACSAYAPWIRDNYLETHKNPTASHSSVTFASDWLYGMWFRLFFAVDGPASNFETRGPLVVPAVSAIVFAVACVPLVLGYLRRIFRLYDASVLGLLAAVTVLYIAVLWIDGFQAYVRTGQPVAINGRYLLPVLLPLMLVSALAINELFKRHTELKLLVGCLAVLSLLWGGGALTYILRSRDGWYWPDPAVRTVNHAVQDTLGPVTPGYRHPGEFLR
jgi:hypothetical protein